MTAGARPPPVSGLGPTMRGIWIAIFAICFFISFYLAVRGRGNPWLPALFGGLGTLFFVEPYVLAWQLRRRRETLQITDWGVRRILAGGKSEQVEWRSLSEIWIVTSDAGPVVDDLYFALLADDGTGVAVPNALAFQNDLLAHLQKLPGFDNQRAIDALGSTDHARFLVWRATAPPSAPS